MAAIVSGRRGTKVEVDIDATSYDSLKKYGCVMVFLSYDEPVPVGHKVFVSHNGGIEEVETVIMGKQPFSSELDSYVLANVANISENPKPEPMAPKFDTLEEFMANTEWEMALALLRDKGTYIYIVESETIMSRCGVVSLDPDGFRATMGVTGLASVYSKSKTEYRLLTTAAEVLEIIRDYSNDEMSEAMILQTIFDGLKEIAERK